MTPLRRLPGTAFLALLALSPLPAAAEVIDRILVHVNARIVTAHQLEERVEATLREAPPGLDRASREQVRKAALKELVNEALLEDRARELDIVSTDAEVEEQIKRLREQNSITTDEEFVKALASAGLTPDGLRDQLKRSSTIQRVVGREVNSKVDLSDDALRLVYEKDKEKWAVPEKVRLAEVLVAAGPGSEEKAREAAALARGGTRFEDVVLRYSDGPTRSRGGDMGTVGRGELVAALDAAAFTLPAGAVSDPIETRSGWHVLKIVEKLPASYRPYSEVKAEILKTEQETQFQKKLAEYIEQLEQVAIIKVSEEAAPYYQPPVAAAVEKGEGWEDALAGMPAPRAGRYFEERRFEVTPTVGYRLGAEASTYASDFIRSLEVPAALSYGLTLEYALGRNVNLELIWSRQGSELKANYLQEPPPGRSERITSLDVDTLQIGALWMLGYEGARLRPYLDLLVGASRLSPDAPLDDLYRLSASVGGGAKLLLSDTVGARLGLRFMPVYLNSTSGYSTCDPWFGCYSYWDANYLLQWDFHTGFTLRF